MTMIVGFISASEELYSIRLCLSARFSRLCALDSASPPERDGGRDGEAKPRPTSAAQPNHRELTIKETVGQFLRGYTSHD